jgi:phospholipase C
MVEVSRRAFLAGTGAVALTSLGTGATAAAGSITDVRHIIVLMQENRSFDHYFGTMKGVRGFADRSTILLNGGYPVFNQPNGSGRQYLFPVRRTAGNAETVAQCQGDNAHSWSVQGIAPQPRCHSWGLCFYRTPHLQNPQSAGASPRVVRRAGLRQPPAG